MNKKKKLRFLNDLSSGLMSLLSIGGITALGISIPFLIKSYKYGSSSMLLDKLFRFFEDFLRFMIFEKWYMVILFVLANIIGGKVYKKYSKYFKGLIPKFIQKVGNRCVIIYAYLFCIVLMTNFGQLFRYLPSIYGLLKINQRFQEVCQVNLADNYTVFDNRCYLDSSSNDCTKSGYVWGMDQMNVALPQKKLEVAVLERGAALLTEANIVYAKSGSSVNFKAYRTEAIFFEDDVRMVNAPSIQQIHCGKIVINQSKPIDINVPSKRLVDISAPANLKDAVVFSRHKGDRLETIDGIRYMPCIEHIKWQAEGVLNMDPFVNSKLILYDRNENRLDIRKVGFEDSKMKLHNSYNYAKNGKAIHKQTVGVFRKFCFDNAYTPGKYFLEVILDVDNVIKETNENNNTYIFPFEIEED